VIDKFQGFNTVSLIHLSVHSQAFKSIDEVLIS